MGKVLRYLNLVVIAMLSLSLLGGCATAPLGPTVTVMPAPGKPFELFQKEKKECQDYAFKEMGGQDAVDSANRSAVAKGIFGAVIGTAAGAVLGSAVGNAGTGAGIGAGAGILGGTGAGASSSANSTYQLQRLYDMAYIQCMYAKGNQVPGQAPAAQAAPTSFQHMPPPPPPPAQAQEVPQEDQPTP